MSDEELKLYKVLFDTVLPNLKHIQASQAEQLVRSDRLNQSLDEFRAEMKARFAELHAELAATRHQVDLTIAGLRESEARVAAVLGMGKGQIVH